MMIKPTSVDWVEVKVRNIASLDQLRRKVREYRALFGIEPLVFVQGTFTSVDDEPVFLNDCWRQVLKIMRYYLKVDLREGKVLCRINPGEYFDAILKASENW